MKQKLAKKIKLLEKRFLYFDGSYGANLQKMGLPGDIPPEAWNIDEPEKVENLHRKFVESGIDFLTTNSFGGNRIKLADYNLDGKVTEINTSAVEIAQNAADENVCIAGSVGPTGALIKPLGMLDFDEAIDVFRQQIGALYESGADLVILETFTDIFELKSAAMAARDLKVPFIANVSLDEGTRTVTGTPVEAFAAIILPFGPLALGINCGSDPAEFPEAIERLRNVTDLAILAEPNAGIPKIIDDRTVFPASPEEFAEIAVKNAQAGANILGGCCGSDEKHIKKLIEKISETSPKKTKPTNDHFTCASRTERLEIGNSEIKIIGERINPSGKKLLKKQIRESKLTRIRQEGIRQEKAGADAIDVNISVPKVSEHPILMRSVRALGNILKKPVFIDSADRVALKKAFEAYPGRAVLNSITGKERDMQELLPLAAKYGMGFVALPLDKNGIPDKPQGRLKIAEKILKRAEEYGFIKSDILFDVLVMPIGSDISYGNTAIETLKLYKQNDFFTIAGLSNISYGLPGREILNSAFLMHLSANGLDCAIADPTSELNMNLIAASKVINRQDENARNYIERFSGISDKTKEISIDTSLEEDIQNGQVENAIEKIEDMLSEEFSPFEIVNDYLIPAIRVVGDRFERKEIFLPVVISSAEVVKKCMKFLEPKLAESGADKKGKIILATVEGDIHDIGKNLVATVLGSYGFEIIDLGKNVSAEEILESIDRHNPDGIGLSALMTTTMPSMEHITQKIKSKYPSLNIVVGGACIDTEFATKIGADDYAKDAIKAAKIYEKLIK